MKLLLLELNPGSILPWIEIESLALESSSDIIAGRELIVTSRDRGSERAHHEHKRKPTYIEPAMIVSANMALSDIAAAAFGGSRLELEEGVARQVSENDADARVHRSHSPNAFAGLGVLPSLTLGERSAFLMYAHQVRFPHYSLEPRSFVRCLMTSLVCLHAQRRDARGLDVINLMIDMINQEIFPEIPALNVGDDLQHALRTIGWCVAGEARVLSMRGPAPSEQALFQGGLYTVRPELVVTSGILQDSALVLTHCLRSFQLICELEAVQRKLVRFAVALSERWGRKIRAPRSKTGEKAGLFQSLDLGLTTELMSDLATRFARAKSAVALHFRIRPHEHDHPLEGTWTLDTILTDLIDAILSSANRSARQIPILATQYDSAIKRWKPGPYAIKGLEEIATLLQINVTGLEASMAAVKDSGADMRLSRRLGRYYVLNRLEEGVQIWKRLLAVEAIVLSELINSGPWRDEELFSSLLNWTKNYSPFENRSARSPDIEIPYLGQMLVALFEPGDIPTL